MHLRSVVGVFASRMEGLSCHGYLLYKSENSGRTARRRTAHLMSDSNCSSKTYNVGTDTHY